MTNKNIALTKLLESQVPTNSHNSNSNSDSNNKEISNENVINESSSNNVTNIVQQQVPTAAPATPGPVDIKTDIRNIMHAFGDSSEPCEGSIEFMEMILRLELGGFLYLCDSAVAITRSKVLGLREAIFTMKNEKHRLLRLFKYFATKDQQRKLMRQNQISSKMIATKSYILEIKAIVESMDESGELLQLLSGDFPSFAKTERALRADRLNLRATIPLYISYAKARSVSFARKLTLLHEWVRTNLRSEFRLSQSFMEVLAFLTYELVAHVIDLTCLVRRERLGYSNPISKLCDPRGANPETCTSAPAFQLQKKRKDDDCNNVTEILVQASEMEAKRMKKVTSGGSEISIMKDASSLTPDEIREAYLRLQSHSHASLLQSYKSRADRQMKLNLSY